MLDAVNQDSLQIITLYRQQKIQTQAVDSFYSPVIFGTLSVTQWKCEVRRGPHPDSHTGSCWVNTWRAEGHCATNWWEHSYCLWIKDTAILGAGLTQQKKTRTIPRLEPQYTLWLLFRYLLSLLEHPKEGSHGANVESMCGDGHDVVQDASQLSIQHYKRHRTELNKLETGSSCSLVKFYFTFSSTCFVSVHVK